MEQGEIYKVNVKYRFAKYSRPCAIIEVISSHAHVGLLSSQLDLYNPHLDMMIDSQHPDFKATGLNRTSYIIGAILPRLPLTAFIKKMGKLEGQLYQDFERWLK